MSLITTTRDVLISKYHSFWSLLVPLAVCAAGILFATSAQTADGTNLRSEKIKLEQLIRDRTRQLSADRKNLTELTAQIDSLTQEASGTDIRVNQARAKEKSRRNLAGLSAVTGPALTVKLNDALRSSDGKLPSGATANDVVVHQQDVQAVINALWAAGAQAIMVMGERIIATSSIRCVGNTLLLHDRTYSPEFVITAVGDIAAMNASLDRSPGVRAFKSAVDQFGLRYDATPETNSVTIPEYNSAVTVHYAKVS